MIEPQNTMSPVAEPRPVDTPQGEGEGFGAMLAQSLGMAPQVNPDVVQQINTNSQPKGQQNPAGEQPGDEPPAAPAIQGVAGNPLPVRAATQAAPGVGSARDGEAQQQVAGPGGSGFVPSRPVRAQRFVRTDQGVAPLPTLPTPPSAEPAPHVVRPLDTIWKPSPQGDAGIPAPPVIPDDGEMTLQPGNPGDSIWKPRLDSEPVPTATPAPPTDDNAAPLP